MTVRRTSTALHAEHTSAGRMTAAAPTTRRYGVWLGDARVGSLDQVGDDTRFAFAEGYWDDPDRPVLGMVFERDPAARHASHLRLAPWFSNLLPENALLLDRLAAARRVSAAREMELLAQAGPDLPGAIRVLPDSGGPDTPPAGVDADGPASEWRFSLAGVGAKVPALRVGDRMRIPAHGVGGDWIVKLPDPRFADVPRNEDAMMSLAAAAGVDVPEHLLVHRDQLDDIPAGVWPGDEQYAYAVRRFDRDGHGKRVHVEDFAQVRNCHPRDKYNSRFETVAALIHRWCGRSALREVARRLAFNILVSNGDAHLKNWSLIYHDPRRPSLSPAYDLVSTGAHPIGDSVEDLGLTFNGSLNAEKINPGMFARLEHHLGADGAGLADCAAETAERVRESWPAVAGRLCDRPQSAGRIDRSIAARFETLLKGR